MRITEVFIDLDDVLADFTGGAAAAHGWSIERLHDAWVPGEWSIVEPMGMTRAQFKEPIDRRGSEFWRNLKPTPWATTLVNLLEHRVDASWYILTNPMDFKGAATGKIEWIRRFLGDTKAGRYIITSHKHLLANRSSCLIDDNQDNCKQFMYRGGQAILFPSRHNALHDVDPIRYVTVALQNLTFMS